MAKVYEQYRKKTKSKHQSNAKNNRKRATLKLKIARYAYLKKKYMKKSGNER